MPRTTEPEDPWYTTEAMIRLGGGFVNLLGQLYRHGDPANQARLRAAFPEYFARYAKLAKTMIKPKREDEQP
jgi:hypothetical protein